MIVGMVAPAADRSIASTRACLVTLAVVSFAVFVGASDGCTGGLAKAAATALFARLVGRFDIGDLHRFPTAWRRHHRRPTSAMKPAGQDPGAQMPLGTAPITAPAGAEGQSFLGNVVAGFRRI